LDNVQVQIARRARPVATFPRWTTPAFAAGLTALLALVAVGLWPHRGSPKLSEAVSPAHSDQVRVAEETRAALGYIGTVLLEAGKHGESALINQAGPPLRRGFEGASQTIKNKL
jgi:hypothetical protein